MVVGAVLVALADAFTWLYMAGWCGLREGGDDSRWDGMCSDGRLALPAIGVVAALGVPLLAITAHRPRGGGRSAGRGRPARLALWGWYGGPAANFGPLLPGRWTANPPG